MAEAECALLQRVFTKAVQRRRALLQNTAAGIAMPTSLQLSEHEANLLRGVISRAAQRRLVVAAARKAEGSGSGHR